MALSPLDTDNRASWLAQWFHSVPHVDYTLNIVNSTFDPRSNLYIESLGIIASVPGIWLILNLLAFLIFFLSRCCEREWKPTRFLTCYKCTLGLLAIFCCGAIGAGFYGNHVAHTGVESFTYALRDINSVIVLVKNQTVVIEQTLQQSTEPELDRLEQLFSFDGRTKNTTLLGLLQNVTLMRSDVHNGSAQIAKINQRLRPLDVDFIYDVTNKVEFIRWPATMALLSVFVLFCIVLLVGVCRSSRSTLIAFTVLGLLAVIFNWLLVSIYLASCVALSDLCTDPNTFVVQHASGMLDRSIAKYYVDCGGTKRDPFKKTVDGSEEAIDKVIVKLDFVNRESADLYRGDTERSKELRNVLYSLKQHLNNTKVVLLELKVLLTCQQIHEKYNEAVAATCTPVLDGLAFMLLSAAAAGLHFILLIWIAAHTWMYIRKRVVCAESDYVQVDEQDPFMPQSAVMVGTPTGSSRRSRDAPSSGRPRHGHTPPQTPPFPGAYNGRVPRGADEHSPMHGRYTPPPSYEQLSAFLPSAPFKP